MMVKANGKVMRNIQTDKDRVLKAENELVAKQAQLAQVGEMLTRLRKDYIFISDREEVDMRLEEIQLVALPELKRRGER